MYKDTVPHWPAIIIFLAGLLALSMMAVELRLSPWAGGCFGASYYFLFSAYGPKLYHFEGK